MVENNEDNRQRLVQIITDRNQIPAQALWKVQLIGHVLIENNEDDRPKLAWIVKETLF